MINIIPGKEHQYQLHRLSSLKVEEHISRLVALSCLLLYEFSAYFWFRPRPNMDFDLYKDEIWVDMSSVPSYMCFNNALPIPGASLCSFYNPSKNELTYDTHIKNDFYLIHWPTTSDFYRSLSSLIHLTLSFLKRFNGSSGFFECNR